MLAQTAEAHYQRNDHGKPSLMHLLLHRKALNFSTWYVRVSFINCNFFDVPSTWSLLHKLLYILAPPLPLWSSLSELLEMLCLRLELSDLSPE